MLDIDRAWEERVLPALSEYTRIPCLSSAFDPEWASHGYILQAAQLLHDWVKDQDAALEVEIVQLPGRTPVLLIDNGGSGDPILCYGHMDKQPPLGTWRDGLSPFEPVREGDLLYGRGTADNKGQHSINMAALRAVRETRGGRRSRSSTTCTIRPPRTSAPNWRPPTAAAPGSAPGRGQPLASSDRSTYCMIPPCR